MAVTRRLHAYDTPVTRRSHPARLGGVEGAEVASLRLTTVENLVEAARPIVVGAVLHPNLGGVAH
jgi:hypothetical protein